jgi:hypothetical protein
MDHLVTIPTPGFAPDLRAAIATLALATSFAAPGSGLPDVIERDLLSRFAGAATINETDMLSYLDAAKATCHDLAEMVANFGSNPEALHTALQQQNDAGGIVLLKIASSAALTDAVSGAALHPTTAPGSSTWLIRSGYSDEPPYGYYYDLLASNFAQPIRILWPTIANAGITAALALDGPKPPIDEAATAQALYIAEQGLATAQKAIADVKAAHGLS